ncbi:hypothetical protein [Spirosoma utsteinense]|uniref:Outer membrane protein beta-barrel domain-containing protein n=1 Tax=Spirosoma utsteinense TaxID=2585773 RepID=A0ABR6W278_9BACT|nr:hypothetical protein [Spirosoma utsteinense]MBC3785067.1 hypothetical protein [Spirosoma utsteinense]MBC3790324.1 hypothetical protein [Spirosoma utsteinense]
MAIYRLLRLVNLLLLAMPLGVTAQRSVIWQERPGTWSLHVGIGPSRYLGDLNEPLDLAQLRLGFATSAAVTYCVTDQLAIRGDLQLYYIRGAQRGTRLAHNNLAFHSTNPDLSVGIQYSIWHSKHRTYAVIPYGIAGIGVTYMTPKAVYQGISYSLAPLQTEGIAYNRLPLIVRYGIGLPLIKSDRFKGSLEGTYTHVASDYLDDVSTQYVDRTSMPFPAVVLSDRSPEIGNLPNAPGAKRGNPARNDGYLTLSARLVFIIMTPLQRNYRRMFGG